MDRYFIDNNMISEIGSFGDQSWMPLQTVCNVLNAQDRDIKEIAKKERTRVLAELFDMIDVYTYKYEGRTYLMMTEFEGVIDELIKGETNGSEN